MTKRTLLQVALVTLLVLAVAPAALAVIKADTRMDTTYKRAAVVVIGEVVSIDAAKHTVDLTVTDLAKGTLAGKIVRLEFADPLDYVQTVQAKQPAVVIGGKKGSLVHLADNWLVAEQVAGAAVPTWKITKKMGLSRDFPGRTVALAAVLAEVKATGKTTLTHAFEHNIFGGGRKDLGNLGVTNPTFMAPADVNGDRKPDLLVGSAAGVKLFLGGPSGFSDVTAAWGLDGADGVLGAFGDVNGDGKLDLLLGGRLYLNAGGKFTASGVALALPAGAAPLAMAIGDATGDKLPDAVYFLKSGELLVFANDKSLDKPWPALKPRKLGDEAPVLATFGHDWTDNGELSLMVATGTNLLRYAMTDAGGPPMDIEHLTGESMTGHMLFVMTGKRNQTELKIEPIALFPLDADGDGRRDLILVNKSGSVQLYNRGFGCFFINTDGGGAFRSVSKFNPGDLAAAADLHDDKFDDGLCLTAKGQLIEAGNTPFPPHP